VLDQLKAGDKVKFAAHEIGGAISVTSIGGSKLMRRRRGRPNDWRPGVMSTLIRRSRHKQRHCPHPCILESACKHRRDGAFSW
jgi:hypothetical protein